MVESKRRTRKTSTKKQTTTSKKRTTTGGKIRREQIGTTADLPSKLQTQGQQVVQPIEVIQPRREGNLRDIVPSHVFDLADSIAVVGNTQLMLTDMEYRLIAGGHRRCALRLMLLGDTSFLDDRDDVEAWLKKRYTEEAQELYRRGVETYFPDGQVKVAIADDLTVDDPDYLIKARAKEAAENTRRLSFNREDIRGLAQQLSGVEFTHLTAGRPKEGGPKSLKSHLSLITGMSSKTIQRALNAPVEPIELDDAEVRALAYQKAARALDKLMDCDAIEQSEIERLAPVLRALERAAQGSKLPKRWS